MTDIQRIHDLRIVTPAGRPVWYPEDAVLTSREVGEVLGGLDERTVRRLPIRTCRISTKTRRYLFRDVIAFLNARAA